MYYTTSLDTIFVDWIQEWCGELHFLLSAVTCFNSEPYFGLISLSMKFHLFAKAIFSLLPILLDEEEFGGSTNAGQYSD